MSPGMNMSNLTGRVALITGSSRGLGLAMAEGRRRCTVSGLRPLGPSKLGPYDRCTIVPILNGSKVEGAGEQQTILNPCATSCW